MKAEVALNTSSELSRRWQSCHRPLAMTIAQISRVTTPSTTIDKEAENRKERERERERSIDHVDGFLVSSSFQVRSSQSDIVAVAQRRFLQNVSCLDGFQTSKQQERGREEVQRANVPQIAERKRLARSLAPLGRKLFPSLRLSSSAWGLGLFLCNETSSSAAAAKAQSERDAPMIGIAS